MPTNELSAVPRSAARSASTIILTRLLNVTLGAQFNLPYLHVVVNNSYLGLIRQISASQRGKYAKIAKDKGREAAIKEMQSAVGK